MKIKMKTIFALFMLFLIIFSISIQYNMRNYIETAQEDIKTRTVNLKQAGFWSNFTFIHIILLGPFSEPEKQTPSFLSEVPSEGQ